MTTQEFEYKGMHCKKWLSDNEKAKIQIIHGLGEMSEYYEQFAEYITAKEFRYIFANTVNTEERHCLRI